MIAARWQRAPWRTFCSSNAAAWRRRYGGHPESSVREQATLHALVGCIGAHRAASVALLSLTLWLTGASLKRTIGRVMMLAAQLRPPPKPPGAHRIRFAGAVPLKPPPAYIEEEDEMSWSRFRRLVPPLNGASQTTPQPSQRTAAVIVCLISLLMARRSQPVDESSRSHVLEDTLANFGVGRSVVHIERGPLDHEVLTQTERGVTISRIASLADDLALALAATAVRIEAPIPGMSAIGIESSQQNRIDRRDPRNPRSDSRSRTSAAAVDGARQGHYRAAGFRRPLQDADLLVAGATGAGKSVCLNTIVASLLVSATPDQVQLLMIDPKRVELTVYNGIRISSRTSSPIRV